MSHDPEAVEAIRDALAAVADGSGQEETVADALRDWLTDRADVFADALAAAGYTVTRDRYEGAGTERGKPWWICANGNVTQAGDQPRGDWRRLYRKIEGSTDG